MTGLWLETFLAHPYFAAPPPKSTGRETFGQGVCTGVLSGGDTARLHGRGLPCDGHASYGPNNSPRLCRLAAATRQDRPHDSGRGGVHNKTLMRLLAELLLPHR